MTPYELVSSLQRHFIVYQGRHGEFEPDKALYSTPKFFDRLFLMRAYWNPKFRKARALEALVAMAALQPIGRDPSFPTINDNKTKQ